MVGSSASIEWICSNLSKLLNIDASEDIASYILDIESKEDVEEYIQDLLNPDVPSHKRFIKELLKRWQPPLRNIDVPSDVQVYKKSDEADAYFAKDASKKKGKKEYGSSEVPSTKGPIQPLAFKENKELIVHQKQANTNPPDVRKKSKFVPLFSEEGEAKTVAKLPGRHPCECLAGKHPLINNCIKCGRIVCEQEGSGPCITCGALVCTREEMEILSRGTKKSDKLRSKLMGGDGRESYLPNKENAYKEGLEKAMSHKNKLLEYDKTSVKRTKVIDDEADYFSADSNTWLSKQEKDALRKREEELRALRHGSRKDRKITLDFAGRRVVEDQSTVDVYDVNDDVVQQVHYGKKTNQNEDANFNKDDFCDLVNPNLKQAPPQFVPSTNQPPKKWGPPKPETDTTDKRRTLRIQDKELQEMSDEGMCMSMHQPWASLLVRGIKKHEGRSWYSAHRGRLWIAATAKAPCKVEIDEVEDQYRVHYKNDDIEFPSAYPTSCLLGSVDVQDVLAEDEYREKYPDGESGSPYVFICENTQELLVKLPIKGKHKIYKLDPKVHQGAKKGARQVLVEL